MDVILIGIEHIVSNRLNMLFINVRTALAQINARSSNVSISNLFGTRIKLIILIACLEFYDNLY